MIQGQVKRDIITTELGSTTKMTVEKSDEVEAHIVRVLTENYKYPKESHVREAVSNHWDANYMAGKEDAPIFVKIYKDETSQWVLETSDEALGMDEEDFDAYYMKIGASNKRNNPFVIGGKGCGAKSILSYTDSYEVITRKNFKEYKFLVFKGSVLPEKLKVYEKDTELPNGVIIKVKIKRWDENAFKQACFEQLCYFPTVVFQFEGDNTDYLSKQVFETDLFKWSEIYPSTEMHISLGLTHYKIDWDVLGISKLYIPIAIKIPLDSGIDVFFNRESIIYNEFAKNYIKDKIQQISDYFVNKHNEQILDEYELLEIFDEIDNNDKVVKLADEEFKINPLLKYSTIQPKELKIKGLVVNKPEYYYSKRNYLLDEYETVLKYERGKCSVKHISSSHSYVKLLNGVKHIQVDKTPTGLVRRYLLEKYNEKQVLFVKKSRKRDLGGRFIRINDINYKNILNLATHPKDTFRQRIIEWQFVENQFKALIIDEKDVETSAEYLKWLNEHKEQQKFNRKNGFSSGGNYKVLNKQQGQVTLSYCIPKSKGSDYKFEKSVKDINSLYKQPNLTILFTEEEKELALQWRRLQDKWKICIIGKNEAKKIEGIHNHITYKQFMEKSKAFKRLATSFLYEDVIDKFEDIFERENIKLIQDLIKPFSEDINKLKQYISKNGKIIRDNELIEMIKATSKEYNLYDFELNDVYLRTKANIEKYSFLSFIKHSDSFEDKERIKKLINQILYLNKTRHGLFEELEITVVKQPELILEEELV